MNSMLEEDVVMRAVRRISQNGSRYALYTYTPTGDQITRDRLRQLADHLQYALSNPQEYALLIADEEPPTFPVSKPLDPKSWSP